MAVPLRFYAPTHPEKDGSNMVTLTVGDNIADGATTSAPSQNAVFDALATKMQAVSDGSYYGLKDPAGSTSNWIRTTTSGIIPATSGGASSLGTSSWPFLAVYANNFYGTLNGNITGNASGTASSTPFLSPYGGGYNTGTITDSTTAVTLCEALNGSTNVAMMSGHGLFGGYATVLNMSGYARYGATQIAAEYNAAVPALAVRNYNQTSSAWNSWIRILTTANIGSQTAGTANNIPTSDVGGNIWIA